VFALIEEDKKQDDELSIDDRFGFDALDYYRVRDELRDRLQSDISIPKVDTLVPSTDRPEIAGFLDETDDARRFIDRERATPILAQMDDIRIISTRAAKGAMLSIEEIVAVGRTIRILRVASDVILKAVHDYPLLEHLANGIARFPDLEEDFSRCIHPEGWILDSASSDLRKIRKSLEAARTAIEGRLRKMLANYGRKGYLRDDNFTMKNGRYVLPFRSEYLREEKVVIQSVSETRQTFFVEPLDMVERNNNLQRLHGEEDAEIERILYQLSSDIGDVAPEMKESLSIGIELDFIFAKGRLSADWACVTPRHGDEILIRAVRHPFLKVEPIPVDIAISGRKGLIITGPNAGGKTIGLKSIGICALLNQSGLHVPCDEGTILPLFGSVLAEIGDRQNIDLSLSSFSAHIEFLKGMTHIIERSSYDKPALVLLDEIGRSTDPQEGSALALAVIEYLIEKGAYFAVTTHLPALKNLVMERGEDLTAASVEFDIDKVEPLYRLKLDSLGASYAILMSERFGLDKRLVRRAKEIVGEGTDLLEIDIALLQAKRDTLKDQVGMLDEATAAIDEERTKLVALGKYVIWDILKGVEEAYEHAREVVSGAEKQRASILKQTCENVVVDKSSRELDDGLKKIRRMRNLLQIPEEIVVKTGETSAEREPLHVGDKVWLIDLKKEGEVIEEGRRGQFKVLVESLKMTVEKSGLKKIIQPKEPEYKSSTTTPPVQPVLGHIDLHGYRVEEGLRELDDYLDSAYCGNKREVCIVHGIGTGQLRRGVREHLKKHELVEAFRSATPSEGGAGATIVRFKE